MKQAVPWWFFFPDVTFHYLMWLLRIAAVPWGWCDFSRLMWLKYGACIANAIIPTDFHIFRGVSIPPSRKPCKTHVNISHLAWLICVVSTCFFSVDAPWLREECKDKALESLERLRGDDVKPEEGSLLGGWFPSENPNRKWELSGYPWLRKPPSWRTVVNPSCRDLFFLSYRFAWCDGWP